MRIWYTIRSDVQIRIRTHLSKSWHLLGNWLRSWQLPARLFPGILDTSWEVVSCKRRPIHQENKWSWQNPSRIWIGRARMLLRGWYLYSTSWILICELRIESIVISNRPRDQWASFCTEKYNTRWDTENCSTSHRYRRILSVSSSDDQRRNTMTRSWNQYSEFVWKSHLCFRYREGLSSCYWQDPGSNLKGSAKLRILIDPGGNCHQETRIWACFITDIFRILCKNILRVSKKILSIPHRILTGKDAHFGRIMVLKSMEDPSRKPQTFLTEPLFSFWLWSWSISEMNPDSPCKKIIKSNDYCCISIWLFDYLIDYNRLELILS